MKDENKKTCETCKYKDKDIYSTPCFDCCYYGTYEWEPHPDILRGQQK